MGGSERARRPQEEGVSLGWSEGEGHHCHLRKAVVTEGGSWLLANKPWVPSPPSPKHASCLLSFYTVVGRGALERRLFEEDGLFPATYVGGWVRHPTCSQSLPWSPELLLGGGTGIPPASFSSHPLGSFCEPLPPGCFFFSLRFYSSRLVFRSPPP